LEKISRRKFVATAAAAPQEAAQALCFWHNNGFD
jgi:hypothetical protein